MNSANITTILPCSLNNRNLPVFINGVSTIKSNIIFIKDGRTAQAKSLLGLLSLCCQKGDEVEIVCMSRDSDADKDLQEVIDVLNRI